MAGAFEVVRVGAQAAYTVIAGGAKPAGWAGLRDFAWFSPLPDGDGQLMGRGRTGFGPSGGRIVRWLGPYRVRLGTGGLSGHQRTSPVQD